MGKIIELPQQDFSKARQGIPTRPRNHVPPQPFGKHLYLPDKYNYEAGVIYDSWGDEATDFKSVINFGKPTLEVGTAAMGGQKVWLFPSTTPDPRIVVRQTVGYPIKKWTASHVYTVNGIDGGSGNRCLHSFTDKLFTKYFCVYATSTSAGPARISTGFGLISPLGSQTVTPVNYDLTIPLAANRREILSIVYDGTVNGGTFIAYWNSVKINTYTNVGIFTLTGDLYLGTDVRSGTASSDFKGQMGDFILDEFVRTDEEIAALHSHLNKAFA